jgi:choline dehydrogenase-like flavoprotein
MMYDRGSAADYDAWEALGNEGWGWDGLYPFFKKGNDHCINEEVIHANVKQEQSSFLPLNGSLTTSISPGILLRMEPAL